MYHLEVLEILDGAVETLFLKKRLEHDALQKRCVAIACPMGQAGVVLHMHVPGSVD